MLGRIVHKQVNMVVCAVQANKSCFKIDTNFGEDNAKSFDGATVKYPSSILSNEDQMDVQLKHTMPTASDFTCDGHKIGIGIMSRKTFKYRLYPNHQQRERLQATLDVCRELYNAALQERRDGYRIARAKLNYYSQANQLGEIKAIRPDVASLHSQVLQDVLRRVDQTFKSFFLRVKASSNTGLSSVPRKASVRFVHLPTSRFQTRGQVAVI